MAPGPVIHGAGRLLFPRRFLAVALLVGALTGPVAAQPAQPFECAYPDEAEAFAIRSMQARLMVSALSCNFVDDYNAFVRLFRPQLSAAYRRAQSYWIRIAQPGAGGERRWNEHDVELTVVWARRFAENRTDCVAESAALREASIPEAFTPLIALAERHSADAQLWIPPVCEVTPVPVVPRVP